MPDDTDRDDPLRAAQKGAAMDFLRDTAPDNAPDNAFVASLTAPAEARARAMEERLGEALSAADGWQARAREAEQVTATLRATLRRERESRVEAHERGRQAGREAERASIVEWLRLAEHDGQDEHADNFADDIEAGEHAAAPAPKSPPLTDAELREWGHEADPETPEPAPCDRCEGTGGVKALAAAPQGAEPGRGDEVTVAFRGTVNGEGADGTTGVIASKPACGVLWVPTEWLTQPSAPHGGPALCPKCGPSKAAVDSVGHARCYDCGHVETWAAIKAARAVLGSLPTDFGLGDVRALIKRLSAVVRPTAPPPQGEVAGPPEDVEWSVWEHDEEGGALCEAERNECSLYVYARHDGNHGFRVDSNDGAISLTADEDSMRSLDEEATKRWAVRVADALTTPEPASLHQGSGTAEAVAQAIASARALGFAGTVSSCSSVGDEYHALYLVRCVFPGEPRETSYVVAADTHTDGGMPRLLSLGSAVHLLQNATEQEKWAIGQREPSDSTHNAAK